MVMRSGVPGRRSGVRAPRRLRLIYRKFGQVAAWVALCAGLAQITVAQPTSPPPVRDPLMSLMMSQPRLELGPVRATAAFDPPVARPGMESVYRVTFNALEDMIKWPGEVPAPADLPLRAGAKGQILQMTGTNMQPRTTYNFRARAESPGRFTVPEFTVLVSGQPVVVPAASLEVMRDPPIPVTPPQMLILELPATNLFVGQSVTARILSPGLPGGVVQALAQAQINGQGLIMDQSASRQRIETVIRNGTAIPTYIFETLVTPIAAGKLSVFAQGYSVGNRFTGTIIIQGPAVIPGGLPQYTLVDSDPVELVVRPLPSEGKLPGFTGAVGSFTLEPPQLSSGRLQVGEPVRLTVRVRGSGNLARLVAPPAPRSSEWQVLAASGENIPPQVRQAQGFAVFHYTLVPLAEGERSTPPIPFCYFDPERETYVDLTIPSLPVVVESGRMAADRRPLAQARKLAAKTEQDELTLSGLSAAPGPAARSLKPLQQRVWFPLMHVGPGMVLLGLFLWDRRRRYLEQNPAIVLRRRARRALQRQRRALRRAVRSGDAGQFAVIGVSALKVASAPHYPAEPRALVGADILPLLPEADRAGAAGEAIRRVFAAADALEFGPTAPAWDSLLSMHPGLERALAILEAKL